MKTTLEDILIRGIYLVIYLPTFIFLDSIVLSALWGFATGSAQQTVSGNLLVHSILISGCLLVMGGFTLYWAIKQRLRIHWGHFFWATVFWFVALLLCILHFFSWLSSWRGAWIN